MYEDIIVRLETLCKMYYIHFQRRKFNQSKGVTLRSITSKETEPFEYYVDGFYSSIIIHMSNCGDIETWAEFILLRSIDEYILKGAATNPKEFVELALIKFYNDEEKLKAYLDEQIIELV